MLMVLCSALRLLFSHGAVTFEELFLLTHTQHIWDQSFREIGLKHIHYLKVIISIDTVLYQLIPSISSTKTRIPNHSDFLSTKT